MALRHFLPVFFIWLLMLVLKHCLFLAAGSVIIAMHHEQDIRKMGNLRKYLPITYVTFLIGALALAAIPPFAGFYSKDAIIEAVHKATIPGAGYAYVCLVLGSFATAYYMFRVFFLAFHTHERMDKHVREHLHEPSWTMTLPLILLAIPSVLLGGILVNKMLYSASPLLATSIHVAPQFNVLAELGKNFKVFGDPFGMLLNICRFGWLCWVFLQLG